MTLAETRRVGEVALLRYLLGPGGPDHRFLRWAVELSRLCPPSGSAFSVGAVVVGEDGEVLATGFSREQEDHDHAEEVALRKLARGKLGPIAAAARHHLQLAGALRRPRLAPGHLRRAHRVRGGHPAGGLRLARAPAVHRRERRRTSPGPRASPSPRCRTRRSGPARSTPTSSDPARDLTRAPPFQDRDSRLLLRARCGHRDVGRPGCRHQGVAAPERRAAGARAVRGACGQRADAGAERADRETGCGAVRVLRIARVLVPVTLVPIGLASGLAALMATLAVYGALAGLLDVSMNACGARLELGYDRPIMSSLGGGYSIAGLACVVSGRDRGLAGRQPGRGGRRRVDRAEPDGRAARIHPRRRGPRGALR